MTFFESTLVILLAAILLLQVSRRLSLPYPAMLALAGVVVALVPGSPTIALNAQTALALFIAPVLLDAAYDFPPGAARRFWVPLVTLAVVAVLVTAALVAWIAVASLGLPLAAAICLGAIVAPPDAAAAAAILSALSIPRSTEAVLKGESLFNDAMALLLFGGALAVQTGGLDAGVGLRLTLAVPGGLLLGYLCALLVIRINRFVEGSLGGNLLQFVLAFLVWIVAVRLQLSPVLCVVAFAMTLARSEPESSVRMRVHSFAVWRAVVFALNVFAFLVMGMQSKTIVARMPHARLNEALVFTGFVILAVIVSRFVIVIGFNRFQSFRYRRRGDAEPATIGQAILAGWCGMRGLVTLATAFALPPAFPQRDTVVLTAFGVVIATLVVQGLTLAPLIRTLGLERPEDSRRELAGARAELAAAALATVDGQTDDAAEHLRYAYTIERSAVADPPDTARLDRYRTLGRAAIAAERRELDKMRATYDVGFDAFGMLQEELDWRELTLLPDDDRQIEES